MRLSLAAGSILDAPVLETPRIAASAGFPLLGVRLDPMTTRLEQAREIRRAADGAGIGVFDLEVMRLNPTDTDDSRNLHLIDLAPEIGARQVLATSQEPEPARTVERLYRLSEHAAELGVGVALEFMRFTTVRTLSDALSVIEEADHPSLGVLVDVLHLVRTAGRAADLAQVPPGRAPYVQICDAHSLAPFADEAAYEYEARHDRAMPGQGALPLTEFVQACAARSDIGAMSVEVQSASMASRMDPSERATLAYTTTAAVLERVSLFGGVRPS
jgi:sugar phosphate isomerase/epimerase